MKKQLIRLGQQLTESYQKTTLAKIQELRQKAIKEAAESSGETMYNVIRIQAIFSIFIFINVILAVSINLIIEANAPDFYHGVGRLTGFLMMFGIYVLMTLLLPRFKKPIVQALSFLSEKEVERRIDKRLGKLEDKIRNFDPEKISLPKKKVAIQKVTHESHDELPVRSKKTKVKKVAIATGAGVVTMLVLRAVLNRKKKNQTVSSPKNQPIKQAAITLAAEAGKTLALGILRGLQEKDED